MNTNISFEAHDRPISEVLFGNRKYLIPRYQRAYNWGIDQVVEFWEDLLGSDEPYFLGSFIFNTELETEEGHVDIIDGQQRLLTITIMVAVLRDIGFMYDPEKAKLFQRQDIVIEDRDGKYSYRIQPSESLQPFFRKYIQEHDYDIFTSNTSSPEEKRVKDNYIYLYQVLTKELDKYKSNESKMEFIATLRKRVSSLIVINVEISREEDAYEIFETTNARGLDLSVADLLKNLIFKRMPSKDNRDSAKDIWQDITQNIESSGTDLRKFIRYFWISKYAFIPEKKLYRDIKIKIKNWEQLLNDLWVNSDIYNKLLEGNEEDLSEIKYGEKVYSSLEALRIMGVSQCYVFIMAVLRNVDKIHTNPMNVIKFIELFTFQYSVIGKQPTNRIERIYSKYAIKLENAIDNTIEKRIPGTVQSIFSELINELKELVPNQQIFTDSFEEIKYINSESRRKLIVYILSRFESHYQRTDEYKINFNAVNIEHILPQKPSREWELSNKDIKDYVQKLGNLTLLSKRINSRIQNEVISKKMLELEKSEMKVTQKLVNLLRQNNYLWGQKEIDSRQHALALEAYNEIWSIKNY